MRVIGGHEHWKAKAIAAVRPSVEAALLAAVALGCAQAGWSALTPHEAGASGAAANDRTDSVARIDVRTPFSPAFSGEASSNAAAALAGSLQLVGVRMADVAERSGAVMTLQDGQQRAFVVGQEISAGLRLASVEADHIVIAYEGGQREIALAAPARPSFALALMGRGEALAPEPVQQVALASPRTIEDSVQSPFAAASAVAAEDARPMLAVRDDVDTAENRAWLAATMAQVEQRDGAPYGWRVAAPAPAEALAAGLMPGDLIVSVNGAGPARALEALSAVATGDVTLEIERSGGRVTLRYAAPVHS